MGIHFEAKRFLGILERVYTYVTGSIDVSNTVGSGDQAGWVTGETLGTQRGAHVVVLENATALARAEKKEAEQILHTLLTGTLLRNLFDSVSLAITSPVYVYTFSYNGFTQMEITITDPLGNYRTSVIEYNEINLLLESSFDLLLESGDLLLLEEN